MAQRPADLFGFMPTITDDPPPLCDGDCPPWWLGAMWEDSAPPFTVLMLQRWHWGHKRLPMPESDGVLH